MNRTHLTRRETKHLDALLALPLARFRSAIRPLSPDELAKLNERIELLEIKQRWTLGSHGIDRHRAPIELGLLARRRAEVSRALDRGPVPVQLLLVEPAARFNDLSDTPFEEQAA